MLKLLLCEDWVANRDEVLRRLAKDVAERQGERILLVPELISHDMERRLCQWAGDTASRYAQVLSFTRLARRVAESVGAAAEECLDKGGRVVAMAAAVRQLHSKLKAYASVETRPEFLSELVNAVDEFKRCGISPEDLINASRQTEGNLAQKLEELSLILESYDGLCANGKKDPRDQMNWLLEELEDGDFAENHTFYVVGFPDFTRQHMAILQELMTERDLTVALTCDSPNSDRTAFEKAAHTAKELMRCAGEVGVRTACEVLQPRQRPLLNVCRALFQGSLPVLPEGQEYLQVFRVNGISKECDLAARQVLDLVEAGARYRDIGIVCSDLNAYGRMLSLTFGRVGIPLYRSGTEDILHKPGIRTVRCALEAALGGLERRDVIRYLRSCLGLDRDLLDKTENYAILWGISGNGWKQEWTNHPRGLGEDWKDADRETLANLNGLRRACVDPLVRLGDGVRQGRTVAEMVTAVNTFLEETDLGHGLEVLADAMEEAGDLRGAQIVHQLWEILLSALEQMYAVLGTESWDPEAFSRLLSLLMSQYDVGTIPPVLDAVSVGDASTMRCQETKHVLVLGMEEGKFPGYTGSSGVLTDQERCSLRELGVPLTGGAMEGLQAEFAEIYEALSAGNESLRAFSSGAQPSYLHARLGKMAGLVRQKPDAAITDPVEAAATLLGADFQEIAEKLGLRAEFDEVRRRRDYEIGSLKPENVTGLYGRTLRLSASQIDRFAQCRMFYFLQYGLKAKERREASVDAMEFGTYVHAVLEHTARAVMDRGGFRQVSEEETLNIAMAEAARYAQERFGQMDSRRLHYLLERNDQELAVVVSDLWQELSVSQFDPAGFEVAFGDDGMLPAIQIPGAAMPALVRGFVDRVDRWKANGQTFLRVVDYKTGKKELDYCDLEQGLGLQMLLYLFALEQGGTFLGEKRVGAGVQYFPARAPYVPLSDKKSGPQKRSGMLLAEEDILKAMDDPASGRLCCKWDKDGALSGDIASRSQFRLLKSHVYRKLREMVNALAAGQVEPSPYTRGSSFDSCTYCPYASVCHKETVTQRRNFKTIKGAEFWQRLEEEEHHGTDE